MNRLVVLLAVFLAGCSEPPPRAWATDQCMRREVFRECLAALPAGPQATKYNDWDEVVSECDSAAWRQSVRATEHVKPECRDQ